MADITEQEAQSIVNYAAIICNEFEKYCVENEYAAGPSSDESKLNFVTHADNLLVASRKAAEIDGEKHAEMEQGVHAAVSALRSSLIGVRGQAASILAQPLRILGRVYGFRETDPSAIIDRIYDYFVDTGRRIQSRGLTVGSVSNSPASGSNAGNGNLFLRPTMSTGDPCDNLWAESVLFRCEADEHSGASEHRERFSIEGDPAHPDGLTITGSGSKATTTALTPSDSLALNSSFTNYSGAAATPTFTNWTATGGTANVDAETTITYRDSTAETTAVSVKFNANDTLTQNFNARGTTLRTDVPYIAHLAYKPSGSGVTANLGVTIGNNSTWTTAVDGSASTAWGVFTQTLFFRNLNKEDPEFTIQVSSLSGGQLYIDDFIFAPMSSFNGLYYALIGGSTPFLRGDGKTYSITETAIASRKGIVNEWLWKAYNKYLPCEASPSASATPKDWVNPADYL